MTFWRTKQNGGHSVAVQLFIQLWTFNILFTLHLLNIKNKMVDCVQKLSTVIFNLSSWFSVKRFDLVESGANIQNKDEKKNTGRHFVGKNDENVWMHIFCLPINVFFIEIFVKCPSKMMVLLHYVYFLCEQNVGQLFVILMVKKLNLQS